uniref:Protein phosphatase 1 regulatory subunit 14D n=1 Tax=Anser cygnoides TaxID=8845 RepID=A0A8B9DSH5_ANSCY
EILVKRQRRATHGKVSSCRWRGGGGGRISEDGQKLGKLTIKYNRKDLQRWLDLEEWVDAQLQELYQYPVSRWGKSAPCSLDEWDKGSVCWGRASSALLEIDPCLPSLSAFSVLFSVFTPQRSVKHIFEIRGQKSQ